MKNRLLCITAACMLAACATGPHEPRPLHIATLHPEHVTGRYVVVGGRHHIIGCGQWGDVYDVENPAPLQAVATPARPEPYVAIDGMVEDRVSTFDHDMRPSIAVASAVALPGPPAGCKVTPTPATISGLTPPPADVR